MYKQQKVTYAKFASLRASSPATRSSPCHSILGSSSPPPRTWLGDVGAMDSQETLVENPLSGLDEPVDHIFAVSAAVIGLGLVWGKLTGAPGQGTRVGSDIEWRVALRHGKLPPCRPPSLSREARKWISIAMHDRGHSRCSQHAGVCYIVTLDRTDDGPRMASWFAPAEGTIWPDSDVVCQLLKSHGVAMPVDN